MKLSEAAILCEGNSRAFTEVYKIYNFKDDDDLRGYCDFVIHEPTEWMRGFPAAWKSTTMFSKPRAAFHRLLRAPAVIEELGETYCEQVHGVVWTAFKNNMTSILEKRAGSLGAEEKQSLASVSEDESDLTAESVCSDTEELPPVPHVPLHLRKANGALTSFSQSRGTATAPAPAPKNAIVYAASSRLEKPLDYKQKYEVTHRVLMTLLGRPADGNKSWFQSLGPGDENARLRAALSILLTEYEAA
jgi:hypothetical protein